MEKQIYWMNYCSLHSRKSEHYVNRYDCLDYSVFNQARAFVFSRVYATPIISYHDYSIRRNNYHVFLYLLTISKNFSFTDLTLPSLSIWPCHEIHQFLQGSQLLEETGERSLKCPTSGGDHTAPHCCFTI